MRVIITGGTGLIGSALAKSLNNDGYEVILLSRNPHPESQQPPGVRQVKWDAVTATGWGELADGAEAIINFAGESIADGRWSQERKRRIYSSRVDAGKAVMQAIEAAATKPKILIQASAVGYYGARKQEVITETAGPGADFLSQVCFDWEAATGAAESKGVRRVVVRTGLVLSKDGGAWPPIVRPFHLFAGGRIGSGDQFWPWIHMDDEVGALRFLINNERATGFFNLTAPTPLANKDFAAKLGSVMGRPAIFPVPSFALKTIFGEMSTILLDGQRAVPQRLQDLRYVFKFPNAEAAFKDLLSKS